jgi:hypothetical protein
MNIAGNHTSLPSRFIFLVVTQHTHVSLSKENITKRSNIYIPLNVLNPVKWTRVFYKIKEPMLLNAFKIWPQIHLRETTM